MHLNQYPRLSCKFVILRTLQQKTLLIQHCSFHHPLLTPRILIYLMCLFYHSINLKSSIDFSIILCYTKEVDKVDLYLLVKVHSPATMSNRSKLSIVAGAFLFFFVKCSSSFFSLSTLQIYYTTHHIICLLTSFTIIFSHPQFLISILYIVVSTCNIINILLQVVYKFF